MKTYSGGLRNLCRSRDNLFTASVGGLDVDDNVSVAHTNMAKLDLQVIAWNDHADEADVVTDK